MEGKSLVMLDTNQIRLEEHMETDYSKCELKGFILSLIKYIEDSNLQKKILIVLPEVIIEEVLKSKEINFNKTKEILKNKTDKIDEQLKKFLNLDGVVCPAYNIPDINIEYKNIFSQKFKEFLENKSFIEIIPITNKDKLFDSILQRAINHDKPFSEGSDKGFKDAVIWELFLNFEKIDEFDYYYIVSENKTDFNYTLENEFSTKKQKNLKIFYNIADLRKELNLHYHLYEDFPDLIKVVKDPYFQSKVKEKIVELSDFQLENIEIIGRVGRSLDDPATMYVFHFYPDTTNDGSRENIDRVLEEIPLFCTEIGASEHTGGGKIYPAEIRRWMDFMDERNISWCNWNLSALHESSAALQISFKLGTDMRLADKLSPSGELIRYYMMRGRVPEKELVAPSFLDEEIVQ